MLAALPFLAWAIFIGAATLAIFLGALLAYHWFRYAMNPAISVSALVLYSIGVAFLLSGLLAATIAL